MKDPLATTPPPQKRGPTVRPPGSTLAANGLAAEVLIDIGMSLRKTAKVTGVSERTVARISKHRRSNRYANALRADHVDAIKNSIRDKFLVASNSALDTMSDAKLKKSSALELAKISSICLENAGLGPTPIGDLHQNFFFTQVNDSAPVVPTPPVDITPATTEPAAVEPITLRAERQT